MLSLKLYEKNIQNCLCLMHTLDCDIPDHQGTAGLLKEQNVNHSIKCELTCDIGKTELD